MQNIRDYWNYVSTSTEDSDHICDCEEPKEKIFTYGHKNVYHDILEVRLHLCCFCYTYGFYRFLQENNKLPRLRCEGSEFRRYVISLLDDKIKKEKWKSHSEHTRLEKLLANQYYCHYYSTVEFKNDSEEPS